MERKIGTIYSHTINLERNIAQRNNNELALEEKKASIVKYMFIFSREGIRR